ncbi:MAG: hypothetical protein II875_03010 [Clostridia bacterium]|nr:hypothetical protein [Clostridia bacterium]
MKTYSVRRSQYRPKWLVGDKGKWILLASLVFLPPLGLYLMWTEAKWRTWLKIAVSVAWAAVIVIMLTQLIELEEPEKGSVKIKELTYNTRMLAPLPPEDLPDTSQLLRSTNEQSSLISEPTPTPVPTMVYCNDNGKYYHLKDCRYVHENTPRVTLTAAKNAGKTACPTCNPPREETYDN